MIKARRSDIIDTVTFERFCRTELGVKESWCATDVLHGVLRMIADEEDDGYGSSVFNPVDVEELLTLPLKMLQRYAHRAEPLLLPAERCRSAVDLIHTASHCSFCEAESPRYPEIKAGRPGRSDDTAAVVTLMTKVRRRCSGLPFCFAMVMCMPPEGAFAGVSGCFGSRRGR
jgi:hypothetical protein